MRLIDADALVAKELEQKEYWMSRGHGDGGTNIVLAALEQAPTIPAEIVVHCGDCIKQNTLSCSMSFEKIGGGWITHNSSDGYCSYGKRRESEESK